MCQTCQSDCGPNEDPRQTPCRRCRPWADGMDPGDDDDGDDAYDEDYDADEDRDGPDMSSSCGESGNDGPDP